MITYYICVALSVLTLISGVIYISFGLKTKKKLNVSLALAITLAITLFLLRVPAAASISSGAGIIKVVNTASLAILRTLQSFSLDEEYLELYSLGLTEGETFTAVYGVYLSIINVLAPIVTYSAVFFFLTSIFGKITLSVKKNKEKYVFSSVSEKALIMGESLRRKDKDCLIVYASTDVKAENFPLETAERIKAMHALTQKASVENLNFSHEKDVKLTYVLDEGELKNFELCSSLCTSDKLNGYYRVSIFLMSASKRSEGLLQNVLANRKNINVKLYPICEENTLIYKLLIDEPLYLRSGEDKLTAMIIGDGDVAYEAIKAIIWCGQYAPAKFKLHVLAENAKKAELKLKSECEELFTSGEYDLKFVDIDYDYLALEDYAKNKAPDANYILLAQEDDGLNIELVKKLECVYNRLHLGGTTAPVISYLIKNDDLIKTLGKKEQAENECILYPFGGYADRYNIAEFFNTDLEQMGLGVHFSYYGLNPELNIKEKNNFYDLVMQGVDFTRPFSIPNENGEKEEEVYSISDSYYSELIDICFRNPSSRKKKKIEKLKKLRDKKIEKENPQAEYLHDKEVVNFVKSLNARENCLAAFYSSIYNKNSSYASAVHLIYNMFAAGVKKGGGLASEEELISYENYVSDVKNLIRLSMLEHCRWNAFMRAEGYRYPTEKELEAYGRKNQSHKNDALKLHLCLVKWDKPKALLCDEKFNPKKEYFEKYMAGDEDLDGLYKNLDPLDIVSLKTSKLRGKICEHKSSDAVIILNTAKILRKVKKKA